MQPFNLGKDISYHNHAFILFSSFRAFRLDQKIWDIVMAFSCVLGGSSHSYSQPLKEAMSKLDMMANAYSLSTSEAKPGGSPWVQGQPGL